MNSKDRSMDEATLNMLKRAKQDGFKTAWDRLESMLPQCGFGELGICCRNCNMGPCRINPFDDGSQRGVCGASADTIVARNLLRMIAGGAAAHSDHGRDIAHTLLMASKDESSDYKVKDEKKLRAIASDYGIQTDGKDTKELAGEVAKKVLSEFGQQEGELTLPKRAPEGQIKAWKKAGITPRGMDREIVEAMHRTHMGVDNDYRNIILHGLRTALSDGWGGSMIATDLSDVLFKTPDPVPAQSNLGVLEKNQVNLVVHGHEPTLSEMIVEAAQDPELVDLAAQNGAEGINITGMCCTANEILMRHGIPVAGNFLQQELAITTGAVELMLVDVQCIMPALSEISSQFHTDLVTTSPKAKFPGVEHIEFKEEDAQNIAKKIVRKAVENFKNRDKDKLDVPDVKQGLVAGFTAENVFKFLGGTYRSTYRPLNDNIAAGRIRGVAGVVGCNNPKIAHDYGHVSMVKELIKKDVLVVQTGCSAVGCGKAGLMDPRAAYEFAGKGLQEVCEAVGIPPVLHLGSCVDNSRILMACTNMVKEGGIGEDISQLPVAGAAPEWMSEKAISIGFYFVASGVFTVFANPLPVLGSQKVTKFVCEELEDIVGGKYAFEPDPVKAAAIMIEHIDKKRKALKLEPMMYEEEIPVAAS